MMKMKLSFIIYNHNLGLMLLKSECNMEGQIDQAKETTYKRIEPSMKCGLSMIIFLPHHCTTTSCYNIVN